VTPLTGELAPVSLNGTGESGTTAGLPARITGGHVHLDAVTKRYGRGAGSVLALDGIDLDVRPGEFVCLVGASGCGKTTLLNLVADLDQPTSGTREVSGKTGVMFQEAALFPWLTVAGNIELAQRLHGVKKAERRQRVDELLELVHLGGFGKKRPHELSGGMRQRVALARTLAQDADVLLMDEPFGALDAITRDLLHDELERLYLSRGFTVLFVTHNVREAVRLAQRVVLLSSRPGRINREWAIDIPQPRRIEDAAVADLSVEITDELRGEIRRHGKH
jgi:NitT/TauT family transport system ATP-binding protein